jgi:hypothetical protein
MVKDNVNRTTLVTVTDVNGETSFIVPIFDLPLSFKRFEVVGVPVVGETVLPFLFNKQFTTPFNVAILYTDDPTPTKAYGWVSLGHTAVRIQFVANGFKEIEHNTIIGFYKNSFRMEHLRQER